MFCPVSLLSQCPQHVIDECVGSARTHTCLVMATRSQIPSVLKSAARGKLLTPESVLEIIQKHDGICSRTDTILKLDNALKFRNSVCSFLNVDNVTACALRCQIIEKYAGEQLKEDIAENHINKIMWSNRMVNKVIDHNLVINRTFQMGETCECSIEWGLNVQSISPIGALDTECVRVQCQEMRVSSAKFSGNGGRSWNPTNRRELVPEWVCVVCFGLEFELQQLLWLLSIAILGDSLTADFRPNFGKKRKRNEK